MIVASDPDDPNNPRPKGTPDRDSQRQLMARKRATERDIEIAACVSPGRRAACEADVYLFLTTYFSSKFYNPWTDTQREMIQAILHAAGHGGDQAIAAPRGDGKTTIAECVIAFCILTGLLRFPVIVAATGRDAGQILDNIKYLIESSDPLAEDYPEVCAPIRALEGATSRGNMQTVAGKRTRIQWGVNLVIFPTVDGSKCSGSVLMACGLDAAIRGRNVHGLRPDFALIDDPETRESAASALQVKQRERTLDQDIGGLAGQGKALARVGLVTILNPGCLADRLTNPTIKESWSGKRYKMLVQKPDREDLWDQFMQIRRHGLDLSETDKRTPEQRYAERKDDAHQFYLDNRAAMDAGAIVGNPHRAIVLAGEVSTLEHCYCYIADKGLESFLCEYQNDPPEESGPETSGINAALVMSRVHSYPQGVLPASCFALTMGVDVSKYRLHWAAPAWNTSAAGFIPDYDIMDVIGTSPEDTNQLTEDQAILQTLYLLRDHFIANPYATEDGEIIEPKLVLIDSGSGLHQPAVYEFCRKVGKPFVAAKGLSRGRGSSPFHPGKQSHKRKIGESLAIVLQENARQIGRPDIWLYEFDADYWKRWVHQRFLTPTLDENGEYRRGGLSLWKSTQSHRHAKFARQIEAEIWCEDFEPGKQGLKGYWERMHKDNHFLDAMAMACVGASIAGVRIVGEGPKKRTPANERPTAAQLAGKA